MGKHKYSNDKITVNWDSETCIHSAVCVKNLSSVFDTKKKPWVNVEGASVKEITDLIHKCPSGALTYELPSEKEADQVDQEADEVVISLAENGPYLIKGNFRIEDQKGEQVDTKATAALCRCGGSSNKPFCDGAHRKVGFEG
jgi:uncharacterized Fe-S cluster protein YjdI